ncbi:MAG: NAD(P)/FAD-dependent oxidoreductase [Mastigocoleus sp. MO_167.B18]|nr:NAD(P)/FAD-dependent oxidoreductase [Mastigocoleus sp. MO_167.B18]
MSGKQLTRNEYDLILIGSGMGALTVASLMSQLRNKRVLVLERHFKAGGFTHDFRRKQFHWDVGLHYVGEMQPGSQMRGIFDLVTANHVQWNKMPEPFDKFVYPEFSFNLYGDEKRYIADLIKLFPQEKSAIRQYFRDLKKAAGALINDSMGKSSSLPVKLLGSAGKLWNRFPLNLTVKDYLDKRFQDSKLKALLVSQWGTYGLSPSICAFVQHATVVQSYLNGGYYPVGGAGEIAASVKKIVEKSGGKFLLNREVTEVLIEDGSAVGVRVRQLNAQNVNTKNVNTKDNPDTATSSATEEYYAPVIVSNVGSANTYLKLIPRDYPIPFRDSLQRFIKQYSPTTNLTVYLGFSEDLRKLGFKGENHWIYGSIDHDKIYECRGDWINDEQPLSIYLSFPSLKDPKAENHTAEIIAFSDYESFAQWKNQPWLHRDDNYQQLKQRLMDRLINFVDKYYPGFADIIAYKELSTPLTNEHFTAHYQGAIYGLPAVCDRISDARSVRFDPQNSAWTTPKTPLPGLYLTGSDVCSLGIIGAMMGGIFTLSDLPGGISFPEVFAGAAKSKSK